jgi:hypothetical protein
MEVRVFFGHRVSNLTDVITSNRHRPLNKPLNISLKPRICVIR